MTILAAWRELSQRIAKGRGVVQLEKDKYAISSPFQSATNLGSLSTKSTFLFQGAFTSGVPKVGLANESVHSCTNWLFSDWRVASHERDSRHQQITSQSVLLFCVTASPATKCLRLGNFLAW